MSSQAFILVVEDDPAIRRGLVDALEFAGYTVGEAADGESALLQIRTQPVDLVLLDWVLPQTTGLQVLERLAQAQRRVPVIMLTARGMEADRICGLRAGADDYVVKPFSVGEVLARVEAVLRRVAPPAEPTATLQLETGVLDFQRLEFRVPGDAPIALSPREAELLQFLWQHRERVVTREEILEHVWNLDPKGLTTRTVDMHIVRIREKLEPDPSHPKLLLTVRGQGYKFMWSEGVSQTPRDAS